MEDLSYSTLSILPNQSLTDLNVIDHFYPNLLTVSYSSGTWPRSDTWHTMTRRSSIQVFNFYLQIFVTTL